MLRRAEVQQDLVLKIIHRQISFIRHILWKGQLEEAPLTGRIEGKRARGRQKRAKGYVAWVVGARDWVQTVGPH